jgi:protein-L-isoaspartate(D-aspartate) O-methyltransferase
MMSVPRDRFVPLALRQWAWSDTSLPIGAGQTISQPSLVARMIDELETDPQDTVLDVGTGSGYQAAVLSKLVHTVISVERIETLKESAASLLAELGYGNVEVIAVETELGWPSGAPYDGIIVGAASPVVPEQLVQQLKIGGRLVIPVGDRDKQTVVVVQRTESGVLQRYLEPVRFVPLIGPGAWRS